jgi:hypothetical protein
MSFLWGAGRSTSNKPPNANRLSTSGGQPLEFIRWDSDTKKFEVSNQALDLLHSISTPVAVICVAGRARQGKSYLLNQLLGQSGGFRVDSTHRPCTKGLWMWSTPVKQTALDGSPYHLFFFDTEGIDAFDQTGQYSTQIFTLAVLLSSFFIFNQLGGIDEAALDRLSLVTEMTKHVRMRSGNVGGGGGVGDRDREEEDANIELASFTPAFLWLLRDFYLKLEEDGKTITPGDYLESALRPLSAADGNASVKARNDIRESIKTMFPDRDCFSLVRPVAEEDQLMRLDAMPPEALRPEFQNGMRQLTTLILRKAQPKRLGTQVLTGPVLAGLASAYVAAINSGAVPSIASAWQGVAEAESRRAADAAQAAWSVTFRPEQLAADEAVLNGAHQLALEVGQRAFNAVAIGDEGVKSAHDKQWKEACSARYMELKTSRLNAAAVACEQALAQGTAAVSAAARAEGATVQSVVAETKRFEEAYRQSRECSGPTKWVRFADFMLKVFGTAVADLAQRQMEKMQSALTAATQHAQHAEQTAAAIEREMTQRVQQLEAGQGARVSDLQRQLTAASQEIQTLRRQVDEMHHNLGVAHNERNEWQRAAATAASLAEQRVAGEAEGRVQAAEQRAVELQSRVESLQAALHQTHQQAQQVAGIVDRREDLGGGGGWDDGGGGGGGEEAGPLPPPAAPAPSSSMTMEKIKSWLMENGHESEAWQLANRRAKKSEWVELMMRVVGGGGGGNGG